MRPVNVTISILNADLVRLADEVQKVELAGADRLHIDIMDGSYVPNLTFGPAVVAALAKTSRLPLDVHLMIRQPERYLSQFADAGASTISFHADATTHVQRALAQVRHLGKRSGLALSPHVLEDSLRYVLPDLDHILVMSVNPGFGGQKFLPQSVDKIVRIRQLVEQSGYDIEIAIDGGIDLELAPRLARAGVDTIIVGHAVFAEADPATALKQIRARLEAARAGEA